MRRLTFAVVALGMTLVACGGAASGKTVTESDFGDAWPLTVPEGTLHCEGSDGIGAVTIEVDGTVYALNGIAKGRNIGVDIDPIWADDPVFDGMKKNIGDLISEGLSLCA